jgi:hypothetical protein
MIPRWPEPQLPGRFLMDNFNLGMGDSRLNTKMDSGTTKTRRRSTRAPRPFATGIIATTDQFVMLDRFIRDDLKRGVLPFYIRDQILDGIPLLTTKHIKVLDPKGRNILTNKRWLVKFGENFPSLDEAVTDRHYRITFDLLILPR